MGKWIKNYMESKGDGETASALMEEYDVNSDALKTDVHKSHLSRKQKRYKKQINGVTKHTKTLSPKQSLMLMITLFFVIIASCLIALWLYSVHKNTLII